jgi:hypothetical protein
VFLGRGLGPNISLKEHSGAAQEAAPFFMEQESGTGNRTVILFATGGGVRIVDETQPEVITIHAVGDPHPKRRGEATEAEFIARACDLDFRIAKPWGDSDSYDVLVGMGRGFWRVQVKRAPYLRQGQYVAQAGGHSGNYTKEDIDFIAAHVIQQNLWYIVPIEAFEGRTMLHFHPKPQSKSKYEKYREAWCLLACEPKARGWQDIPVLCRCKELPVRCAICPHRT